MSKNREMKYLKFEIKANDDESTEDQGYFEGEASVFDNIDLGYDRMMKGAFTKTIKELGKKRVLLFLHNHSMLIGDIVDMKQTKTGLFVKGFVDLTVESGRNVWNRIKAGTVDSMSIGYWTMKYEYVSEVIKKAKASVRNLLEVALMEISLIPVGMPMNPKAKITDIKSTDGIYQIILENKDKDGFKEKIYSLFDNEEPGITTPEVVEKSEDILKLRIKNNIMKLKGGM